MVKWTPENDARLFAAVLQVCTVGKAQMTEMAAIVGGDCNAKAIENRVYFLKKKAKAAGEANGEASPAKTTKKQGVKRGKKAKGEVEASDDEEVSTPAKKVKRDSHVDEKDGIEVGEDVGVGLRSVVKNEQVDDDDYI